MNYNIHPLIVHFPIALLTVYSVIKIIPFKKWFPRASWEHIERVLLVVGLLGACVALLTGEIAEQLVKPNHALVEMHSMFATVATWLYVALLVGEIAKYMSGKQYASMQTENALRKFVRFITAVFSTQWFAILVALIALGCITLTGLLGGVMVFGTSTDPFAGIVLKLLGIEL